MAKSKNKEPKGLDLIENSEVIINKTEAFINNKKNDYLQPNKFLGKRDDLSPEKMFDFVKKFKNAGATILGGCCETSPQHIKAFASLK